MNGIDTAVASLLANRVDSLLNIGPGSAAASQTGATVVETAIPMGTAEPTAAPQASAQTALSAVALTLDAIMRSGGEATPAVLGRTPIWMAAPALELEANGSPLFDTTSPDASTANPSAASAAATASVAAAQLPVAALAASLEQTVSGSGLFYEAHLAQWLEGQRPPAALADEPQNRLVAATTQLPLDWANEPDPASPANANANPGANGAGRPGTGAASNGAQDGNPLARAMPSIQTAQAARFVAGEVLASSLSELNTQPAHAGLHSGTAQLADDGTLQSSQTSQSMAAAVHPATIALVRQQLDLLATGQFRWTGEAWPGARLDWTIEQDGDEWARSGGGAASEDDHPWRTRLTLSLPTLGTVDADLTLTGTKLIARVQANPDGAARLAQEGESLRQRLGAAGIELHGLTIREIGGGAPAGSASNGAAAAQAASAYARSASAATAATSSAPRAASRDDFDWDM
ncbi:MAG TPA: flagellar hook-length control protein FliK [Paraburkholderia sp.]|jgi:hypothetical protein|nr:flagellar hook-length control protein FliK [Paraburkholderia sp.]